MSSELQMFIFKYLGVNTKSAIMSLLLYKNMYSGSNKHADDNYDNDSKLKSVMSRSKALRTKNLS